MLSSDLVQLIVHDCVLTTNKSLQAIVVQLQAEHKLLLLFEANDQGCAQLSATLHAQHISDA